ncbi:MAG: methionine--tRNA ligase subunit beta, partial [Helicobacter sp.]|nr:methionine--tRNA ligase subunit beta [Helicobacter sp.]
LTPILALFPKIETPLLEEKQKEIKVQNFITKEEFSKIEIKVGTIIRAEVMPKSEKLLKLQVDLGEERERQIIAGIKSYYNIQDLIGRQVCVLANLKPAKLMGELSEGMVLAVKDDEGLSLIEPHIAKKNGSQVS